MRAGRLIRHILRCEVCQEARRRYVAPSVMFRALAPLPLAAGLKELAWHGAALKVGTKRPQAHQFAKQVAGIQSLQLPMVLIVAAAAAALTLVSVAVVSPAKTAMVAKANILTDPGDVRSLSHLVGVPSEQDIVQMSWTPHSGVKGYSVLWSNTPSDLPETAMELPFNETTVTSPALRPGEWYFHLRTLSENGNWTSGVHYGPIIILPPSLENLISSEDQVVGLTPEFPTNESPQPPADNRSSAPQAAIEAGLTGVTSSPELELQTNRAPQPTEPPASAQASATATTSNKDSSDVIIRPCEPCARCSTPGSKPCTSYADRLACA